ncbi:hypothetical protein [Coleofasciculus sp. E1-EBD-02]|uniref:hypothetical protein n=2 Tax=unclassified Coleofasciculus TaxID=2692782 RepID=UPI0032FF1F16
MNPSEESVVRAYFRVRELYRYIAKNIPHCDRDPVTLDPKQNQRLTHPSPINRGKINPGFSRSHDSWR